MPLNSNIILSGQQPNFVNALAQGAGAAQLTNQVTRQNGLNDLYREQGPGIAAGNPDALNALSQFSPEASLGIQGQRQGLEINQANLERIAQSSKIEAAQWAAQQDAAVIAGKENEMQDVLLGANPFYEAGDEQGYSRYMNEHGFPAGSINLNGFPELAAQTAGVIAAIQEANSIRHDPQADAMSEANLQAKHLANQKAVADMTTASLSPDEISAREAGVNLNTPEGEEWLRDSKYDWKSETDLRNKWTTLQTVKSFAAQTDAYSRVVASAKDPSAAGDLALIFNFMKVLDPGSVVRESEFATAAASGSWGDRLQAAANKVAAGERLDKDMRADFVSRAKTIYNGAEQQHNSLRSQYEEIARAKGLDAMRSVPSFSYSPAGVSVIDAPRDAIVIDGYTIQAMD